MKSARRKKHETVGPRPSGLVALLTDFGQQDHYVGVMKGVMAGLAEGVRFIDITHEIPPQDVSAAAWRLKASYPYFPEGTVFLVVVDPGVGSQRRAIVVRTARHVFVAPDNGVLTPVLLEQKPHQVFAITNRMWCLPAISNTFHGRDVFAPVAARLVSGSPAHEVGPRIDDPVLIPQPQAECQDGMVTGRIVLIDRFGNAVTDIPCEMTPPAGTMCLVRVRRRSLRIPMVNSYSEVQPGQPLLITGSLGYLELSIREGSAQERFHLQRGQSLTVTGDKQRSNKKRS